MSGLNVLSLFAGIGGLELGLEQAGMTTVGQVELNPYCQRVLAHHWPEVPRHDDVRTAPDWWLGEPRPTVDLVCGGFPCQPFSSAGLQRGVADERWGWPWFADVVRATRPSYVLVENVPGLLRHSDAFGWLLSDLAALGFNAEWSVLSACTVGAPHARERLFLLAYPAIDDGRDSRPNPEATGGLRPESRGASRRARGHHRVEWLPEPQVDRVAHGVPQSVVYPDLYALGNAVVPAVTRLLGSLIVQHHEAAA